MFAQIAGIIAQSTFNTPDELVEILARVGRQSSANGETNVVASKLDQTADWKPWGARANIQITGHAQRGAPHYFRICRREDIGLALNHGHNGNSELEVEVVDFGAGVPKSADDVMVVVKHFMHDSRPQQIIALVPASEREAILASGLDPRDTAPRRPIHADMRDNILKYTATCRAQGFLSEDASVYLTSWVLGTLPRASRPTTFRWMNWRWRAAGMQDTKQLAVRHYEGMDAMRGVRVDRRR